MVASFFEAIAEGQISLVEAMIKAGANVNAPMPIPGAAPRTPLWVAAAFGRADTARVLIRYRADVNAEATDGHTALGAAILKGRLDVFKVLLDAGAKIESRTLKDAWTPLLRASAGGQSGMVISLLQKGADVNALSANGWSALGLAAEDGHADTVKLLLAHGADVNWQDPNGTTALISAAGGGHVATVEALLEKDPSLEMETVQGLTALFFASVGGHTECVRKLISAGADVNTTGNSGNTPLQVAAQRGHSEVMRLLRNAGAKA